MSTRDLARAAQVSQAYVVALEGSRSSRDPFGPSPTIDVVARLATALGTEPAVLLDPSLRRSGPHVLVIVEDDGDGLFELLHSRLGNVDGWVSAGNRKATPAGHHIRLHDGRPSSYRRERIAASIHDGLAELAPTLHGQRVGMVFSETPSVLLHATDAVMAVEGEWCELVADAVRAAGAEPAWNLCVYELDVLRQMPDPIATSTQLIGCHDTVWCTRGNSVLRDRAAASRLFEQLHPPTTRPHRSRRATPSTDPTGAPR